MTVALSGKEIGNRIEEKVPGSIVEAAEAHVLVRPETLLKVAAFLKDSPETGFEYLNYVTAIDYFDYFEVVYLFTSLAHNHSLTVKTRVYDRENPVVPSITGLWQGADFQEREVYDLMGIRFDGHYNMKRIFLWDGFQGHPLRKDYI